MPRLLTRRKQAWANNYRPDIIKGDVLVENASVAARYQNKLDSMIRMMINETRREVERLFSGEPAQVYFAEDASGIPPVANRLTTAEDASISSQARVLTNALKKKFDGLFAGNSQWIAESFANQSDKVSSTALHKSMQKLTGGLSLPTSSLAGAPTEVLKATIAENVALIKSIPQQYLGGVQQAVMRSITTGNGLATLVPYLEKTGHATHARAKMIANDQTRKAFNSLNKSRMENLGIEQAQWVHIASNAPRHTHVEMNGKIFDIKKGLYDKDEKRDIMPGELINCRCRYRPIIKFGEE